MFLALCLGIGGIHYGCLDDFFMAAIVTGAYGGNFDPHTLFVNGAYAFFLKPFYSLAPNVGWYSIFQFFSVFISFSIAVYCLLQRIKGTAGFLISICLLAALTPAFYLQIGFTQCAAALTAAGILLLHLGNSSSKKKFFILGLCMLVGGIIFRKEGFLLGLPFLIFTLSVSSYEKRKISKLALTTLLACFAAYQGLQKFNQSLFENNDYTYYLNYQWPRAVLGDGTNYDSKTTFDELKERGMSGRDFDLLQRWVFYDTETFSLDSISSIVSIVKRNEYELNYIKLPAKLFFVVAGSFWGTNAWCWGALCLLLFLCNPQKAGLYTWASLALISVCLTYLLLQNRIVSHVENGIWLYAIFCAIPFIKENRFIPNTKFTIPLLGALAAACFVLAIQNQKNIENEKSFFGFPQKNKDLKKIIETVKDNPNNIYLFPFNSYKEYALYYGNPLKSQSPGSLGNMIPIGYWNINFPGMILEMNRRGVENPLRDIIKENVFVVDDDYKIPLEDFYHRHYNKKIMADTIARYGHKSLLKYHLHEPTEGAAHE